MKTNKINRISEAAMFFFLITMLISLFGIAITQADQISITLRNIILITFGISFLGLFFSFAGAMYESK